MKRSYKNLLLLFTLISFGYFLSNCSPKESHRTRNIPEGNHEVTRPKLAPQKHALSENLEKLYLEAEKILELQSNLESKDVDANLIMQKVVIPLRKYAINRIFLSDEINRHIGGINFPYIIPPIIDAFNEGLILVERVRPDLIDKAKILEEYKATLMWDCDKNLEGSCEYVKYYAGVTPSNITRIIKMIHDRTDDENERERLLLIAFDMKNNRLDTSLRFMLLERISKSLTRKAQGELTTEQLRRDADLFANILKIDFESFTKSEDYAELIVMLNPWTLSRTYSDARNSSMTEWVNLAASKLMYKKDSQKTEIHDQLKLAIEGSETEEIPGIRYSLGYNYEQGIDFQFDNISGRWNEAGGKYKKYQECLTKQSKDADHICRNDMTTENFEILEKIHKYSGIEVFDGLSARVKDLLLKDVSFKYDEYLFLVYQLNYGHLNSDDAEGFWNGTNKNQARIFEAVENLIRLQLVTTIVYTNTRMNEFYRTAKTSGIIDLLRQSDSEASRIRKAWSKLKRRSFNLVDFLDRIYIENADRDEELQAANRKKYDYLLDIAEALEKNIKYVATYPNMFPLIHVMAKRDMNDTIYFWGKPFTITNETIIKMFFSGEFPPWFDFGNDKLALDTAQIIYAYYYTLRTQAFEAYKNNPIVNFSIDEFFSIVIKQMLLVADKYLETSNKNLTENTSGFQKEWKRTSRACDEERQLQPIDERNLRIAKNKYDEGYEEFFYKTFEPRSKTINEISFENLNLSIYKNTQTDNGTVGNYLSSFYSGPMRMALKKIRTEAYSVVDESFKVPKYTLNYPRILLQIYQLIYPDQKDNVQQIFDREFSNYNFNRARFLRRNYEIHEEFGDCQLYFHKRDKDIRHAMIFREVKELGDIWDQLYNEFGRHIRNGGKASDVGNLQEIKKKLVSFYTNRPQYPKDYRENGGQVELTTAGIKFKTMDIYARTQRYLEQIFPDQYDIEPIKNYSLSNNIYNYSKVYSIDFNWTAKDLASAREDFIVNGFRHYASVMSWAKRPPSITGLENRLKFLVEFFKLNTFSINEKVKCADHDPESDIYKDNCHQVEASELINFFDHFSRLLNVEDRDHLVLDLQGQPFMHDAAKYETLVKEKNQHVLYAPYDLLFKRILSDQELAKPDDTWFSEILRTLSGSLGVVEGTTFIFDLDDQLDKIIKENYGVWMRDYYSSVHRFLDELSDREKRGEKWKPYKYRYLRTGAKDLTLGTGDSSKYSPYLSGKIYRKFISVHDGIQKNAGGHFDEIVPVEKEKIDAISLEP